MAPRSKTGQAIIRYVPNNDGDKKIDRQERLTAKPTIPTLFLFQSDQKPEVHYVWDISGCAEVPVRFPRLKNRGPIEALGIAIGLKSLPDIRGTRGRILPIPAGKNGKPRNAGRKEGMIDLASKKEPLRGN
jgi:hypothetical protein